MTNSDGTVSAIIDSKTYRVLSADVVRQTTENFSTGNISEKDLEKRVKNLLHQAWGAFYPARPNFSKLLEKLKVGLVDNVEEKALLMQILRIHSSTNERLPILNNFYNEIFNITGEPNTIIDLGCGLNPITIPWMGLPDGVSYVAVDIDVAQMQFISQVVKLFNWDSNMECKIGNALTDSFAHADVVFMFKLIPVLEKLTKNFDLGEFLARFACKYFVITFPLESLSGKNVGMCDFYTAKMSEFIKSHPYENTTIRFPNELVYIIKNRD